MFQHFGWHNKRKTIIKISVDLDDRFTEIFLYILYVICLCLIISTVFYHYNLNLEIIETRLSTVSFDLLD
ncbi:hypothetical protein CFB3_17160 [Clostridium folliculivorans]|uniref:Uncharacterized protein n=1 Tax=Clostridium folliculivorans TaxID=2886038 RepID=A0A9W6D9A3_9CLOT|nr:hypothetical protein CFOLD11_03190 [Clostridium folliculivorans]GKU29609.1 hypothetical protein CFB3_17160 [Clostridium folliculivorans]